MGSNDHSDGSPHVFPKVQTQVDYVEIEHKILDFWKEDQTFDKLREQIRGGKRWSFLDGPITANNPMGVHHAWGRTLKDVFQRYHAMLGHDQRFQNGFDCQGLWVEVEVEKELGFKSKKDIEAFGLDRFVNTCKERVRKFSAVQTAQSVRLGYWMDWDNSYFTMTDENNYTIWSFLKKCHDRGFIYKGVDVMPWCPRCGVGVSQMEMHEGYHVTSHRSTFIRMPIRGRDNEYLMVWTTTPWTLTSNVAVAVHPELKYAKVRCGEDAYWLAEGTLELKRLQEEFKGGVAKGTWIKGVPKLRSPADYFRDRGGFTVEEIVPGEELEGLEYDGPFDDLPAQALPGGTPFVDEKLAEEDVTGITSHRVLLWDEVSDTDGVGIVHIAPGCGKEDRELAKPAGIVSIAPLDEAGRYTGEFGDLAGRSVLDSETTDWIIGHLRDSGHLFEVEQYPHSYPHCWRCNTELLFRQVDEWYIDMSWREEIKEQVHKIQWIPGYGKDRELEWLDNMRDWMISKKRYWGLALPIWVCEDCGHWEVMGGRDELQERAVEGWDEFDGNSPHRPWVDAVKLRCSECGGESTRIEDVGNPWLDAGIVPYSTVHYNTDREYWEKWIPADLVLECFPGQFRNWFYAMLAMSAMMERMPPFKTLLGHALVRDESGNEMHKSQGNAIWFDDAAEKMGVDVMRWLYCGHNPTNNLNYGYGHGDQIRRRVINTLWNVYAFLCNYARLDGFDPESERVPVDQRPDIDRWLMSNVQILVRDAREYYGRYDMAAVIRAAEKFISDLSNWYVRRNRRRFWRGVGEDDQDKLAAYQTLYDAQMTLLTVVAPIIPFLTDEMYHQLTPADGGRWPTSIHLLPFPEVDEQALDEDLSYAMDQVVRLVSQSLALRKSKDIRVRQPLARLIAVPVEKAAGEAIEQFADVIAAELNVKQVVVEDSTEGLLTYQVKADFGKLGKRLGKATPLVAKALAGMDPAALQAAQKSDNPVVVAYGDEQTEIEPDEFKLVAVTPDNLAVSETPAGVTALDVDITDELHIEGLARDVVRQIQQLRKDRDLEMDDHIVLRWEATGDVARAFSDWEEYIQREILADRMERAEGLADGDAKSVKFSGQQLSIDLTRA